MAKYKVLVIAPSWVGDMVMSQVLFKLLYKQHAGEIVIDVLVNSWAAGLVMRMPEINKVIPSPFKHGKLALFERIKLGFSLRSERYDQVFVLPNSFKSAIVAFFSGAAKRTGFVGEMRYGLLNDVYRLDKNGLPLMIDRVSALANQGQKVNNIDVPKLQVDLKNQGALLTQFGLDFATLGNKLVGLGYQIIILGSVKDEEIGQQIVQELDNPGDMVVNLCGKTKLTEVIDLLALTKAVVTNDSGLMHIACAVGSFVVALYGSSSPKFTPPLSQNAQIIQISLDCSPCFQRTCRFGHYHCLNWITPEMVLERICAH
jgi:heptosyltransferase II